MLIKRLQRTRALRRLINQRLDCFTVDFYPGKEENKQAHDGIPSACINFNVS